MAAVGARFLAVIAFLLLIGAGRAQIQTVQVTSTLTLDTTTYSGDQRSQSCSQFITDLCVALNVGRSRFANVALSSADSTTSFISFVILPPLLPTDPTVSALYALYNNEIHKPGSTFMQNALALHIDLLVQTQETPVTLYQCSDGSYVSSNDACAKSSAPASDMLDATTLVVIEVASGGVLITAVILVIVILVRRQQRRNGYDSSRQQSVLQQQTPNQAQSPQNGMILAQIITTDDVHNYPGPYRETQPPQQLTSSLGAAAGPPFSPYSPPLSMQGVPMMVPMQYAMAPVPMAYSGPAPDQGGSAPPPDPASSKSRIVKKGMNLKEIRQKRIGLGPDVPKVDLGDESMPDTDTDF